MENRCISLEIKMQQYKESFQNNQPRNNQNVPEFLALLEINELKGKGVSESDKSKNTSKVIAPEMYRLDLEHTQKNADTLREIVEQARALKPLDRIISSTSNSGSKPLNNTKKNRILRQTSSNKKNKVEDHLRSAKSFK
ncbi:hypothetical protein Tco_1385464 [Tanacetum coccineum]